MRLDTIPQHRLETQSEPTRTVGELCAPACYADVTTTSYLLTAVLLIIQDPFGNYVVQYVLELGYADASIAVMNNLFGHYCDLAQQKFSSNVVEKCLKLGGSQLNEVRCRAGHMLETALAPPARNCFLKPLGGNLAQHETQQQ